MAIIADYQEIAKIDTPDLLKQYNIFVSECLDNYLEGDNPDDSELVYMNVLHNELMNRFIFSAL